jgi:asparagine synthase (glutamine-hydrolysing)
VPYLDRTVVEYAQRLDSSYKIRGKTKKWLHRRVCEKHLPQQILGRKKRGFAVNVVDGWFQSSDRGGISEMLLDESSLMYKTIKPGAVRALYDDHARSRQDNYKILFSLVMLEQWLRGLKT